MKILLTLFALFLISTHAVAATYYVRTDGGTTTQCNGLSNAGYPGTGSAQNCAWHHPFDALPPQGDSANPALALHGGDTLLIGPGSYEMGLNAPGAKAYPACNQNWSWDCYMANIPGGTSTQPTRILGAGWDQGCAAAPQLWGSEHSAQVVSMIGSSNVVLACLEITDHSPCIEMYMNGNSPDACNRTNPPFGAWASRGILAKDSSNVLLQDVNIHGMANRGILAGRLRDWTLNRVQIVANGWAGWDGDLTEAAGSSDSGTMLFQSVEIGWNGCSETYPGRKIFDCWGQQEGGYGDGLGTTVTGGNWVFQNSWFHHNTQDGLDLLYADTTATINVQQSHAEGNAGNQMKLAGSPTVENSVIVGNCSFFQGVGHMSGDNSAGGDSAGDICRALGNALVLSIQPGLKASVQYDTIVGEGDCLILAINGDSTSAIAIDNTALIGKPAWTKANQHPQPQSCFFYWDKISASTWPATYAGNLVWQVKDNACPNGTGNICGVDPKLVNASLSAFNSIPAPGSPLVNAAVTGAGTLAKDSRNLPRPAFGGFDIGATQYQGLCDDTLFGGDFSSSTSAACN